MNMTNQPEITDNFLLLDQMMKDLAEAPAEFKPTHYWKFYETRFVPELKRKGLKNFRRRQFSVLNSFGATDDSLKGRIFFKKPFRGHHTLATMLNEFVDHLPFIFNGLTDSRGPWITEFLYYYVKDKFTKAGLDLTQCPTTNVGNPADLVEVEGKLWSRKHLNFCSIFADFAQRVPLKPDLFLCELGSGLGRNAEIAAHLFPEATLLLFDIPPQLYTANQYLTAIFGDRVIPYDESIEIPTQDPKAMLSAIKGKICILPPWKMPEWAKVKVDVFFNSESFQEMENPVVENYLRIVKTMQPDYIYINAYPNGAGWSKSRWTAGGQETPVCESIYRQNLEPDYELKDSYFTDNLLRRKDYRSNIFRRK